MQRECASIAESMRRHNRGHRAVHAALFLHLSCKGPTSEQHYNEALDVCIDFFIGDRFLSFTK